MKESNLLTSADRLRLSYVHRTLFYIKIQERLFIDNLPYKLVGHVGFEPTTLSPQTRCATRLR